MWREIARLHGLSGSELVRKGLGLMCAMKIVFDSKLSLHVYLMYLFSIYMCIFISVYKIGTELA